MAYAGDPLMLVFGVTGLPEIRAGDDLAELVCARAILADGDIVVVTSKVISKAAGQLVPGERAVVAAAQPGRVVARRGDTVITRTPHGLVLAAAGVDASNVAPGHCAVLPADPDASARSLRMAIAARARRNVAVVITDTAGRAWRMGQTDIAVGCAGMAPADDHAGRLDRFGTPLSVTAPALADEVAAAADLVKGKLRQVPVAVLRDSGIPVLAPGEHGPGSAALVRPPADDLFGLGAREAVVAAVERGDDQALAAFSPDPTPVAALVERAASRLDAATARLATRAGSADLTVRGLVRRPAAEHLDAVLAVTVAAERLCAFAAAHGHTVTQEPHRIDTTDDELQPSGWQAVLRAGLRLGHP